MKRTCPNCGIKFEPNWPTRKYCSDRCADKYKQKRRREIRTVERWA